MRRRDLLEQLEAERLKADLASDAMNRAIDEVQQLRADAAIAEVLPPLEGLPRQELQVTWGQVACRFCGHVHLGAICPRIRSMSVEYDARYVSPEGVPLASKEVFEFWPNDQWEQPEMIKAVQVFGEVGGQVVATEKPPPKRRRPTNKAEAST